MLISESEVLIDLKNRHNTMIYKLPTIQIMK